MLCTRYFPCIFSQWLSVLCTIINIPCKWGNWCQGQLRWEGRIWIQVCLILKCQIYLFRGRSNCGKQSLGKSILIAAASRNKVLYLPHLGQTGFRYIFPTEISTILLRWVLRSLKTIPKHCKENSPQMIFPFIKYVIICSNSALFVVPHLFLSLWLHRSCPKGKNHACLFTITSPEPSTVPRTQRGLNISWMNELIKLHFISFQGRVPLQTACRDGREYNKHQRYFTIQGWPTLTLSLIKSFTYEWIISSIN